MNEKIDLLTIRCGQLERLQADTRAKWLQEADRANAAEERLKNLLNKEWISVSERLPYLRQKVLIIVSGEHCPEWVDIGSYLGGWQYDKGLYPSYARVTHWMHTPETPRQYLNPCPSGVHGAYCCQACDHDYPTQCVCP